MAWPRGTKPASMFAMTVLLLVEACSCQQSLATQHERQAASMQADKDLALVIDRLMAAVRAQDVAALVALTAPQGLKCIDDWMDRKAVREHLKAGCILYAPFFSTAQLQDCGTMDQRRCLSEVLSAADLKVIIEDLEAPLSGKLGRFSSMALNTEYRLYFINGPMGWRWVSVDWCL